MSPGGALSEASARMGALFSRLRGKASTVTTKQAAVGAVVVGGSVIALNSDNIEAEVAKHDPIKKASDSASAASETVVTTMTEAGESAKAFVGDVGTAISDWFSVAFAYVAAFLALVAIIWGAVTYMSRTQMNVKMVGTPPERNASE